MWHKCMELYDYKLLAFWGSFCIIFASEQLYPFNPLFKINLINKCKIKRFIINFSFNITTAIISLLFVLIISVNSNNYFNFDEFNAYALMVLISQFLIIDFLYYTWHRINHKYMFLWRFHAVHHLDNSLDSTTAFRFHFGELTLSIGLKMLILLLLNINYYVFFIYEICLGFSILFHHSNISIPSKWQNIICYIFVTPNFHHMHHHNVTSHTDSNYSVIFSWWDKLLGTYTKPNVSKHMSYGIEGIKDPDPSFLALQLLPFKPPEFLRRPFKESSGTNAK